ncbi:MAG: peptidylprolyl isomerase [Omnitrophica bacterium]|nr:peptidylprolyl isomerase [Candidatus Omnitrophota bacterium]
MLKKTKFLCLTVYLLFRCCVPDTHAEVIDKIVVIVNDYVITQSEVDKILLPIYAKHRNIYSGQELAERIDTARRSVIERLVDDKILLGEAKRRKIEATDDEIEAKVREVRRRFSSEEEFEISLIQENLRLSELKKRFKEWLRIEKLINSEVMGKISVSPTEILDYYKTHKSEFKEPLKVKLRAILVKTSKDRTRDEALKVAQKILYRLREGSDFGLLARQYSDGPYADKGGDMAWVKRGQLIARMDTLVFDMQVGEISGILETKLGFHLFRVEDRVEESTKSFAEEKEGIEQSLVSRKRQVKLGHLIARLKENAYIAFR